MSQNSERFGLSNLDGEGHLSRDIYMSVHLGVFNILSWGIYFKTFWLVQKDFQRHLIWRSRPKDIWPGAFALGHLVQGWLGRGI